MNHPYGTSGTLESVTNASDATVYWQLQGGAGFPPINAWGETEAYTLGGALDVERLHDAATGAVTSITAGPNGSGSVLNLTTSYNASGSRTFLDDLDTGLELNYGYDLLQRLGGVTRSGSGSGGASYRYGPAGQFEQGPAGSYHYGGFPAHSPASTTQGGLTTDYGYNAAGERTASGPHLPQVSWNALGEAQRITTSDHGTLALTYGPDGGLVEATGPGGGRYLRVLLKQTDTNDWAARIIVGGRVIAVVKDVGGSVSTSYLLQGPLGSTRAVATGSGSLSTRIGYSAWGGFVNPTTGTGSVTPTSIAQSTTVTYTGHELIAGAGLIDMGARLYDPATGLFMSPDPTVASPFDTQDLNQYAYVEDNPLSFVDPYGYFRWGTFFLGIGQGLLAGFDYGVIGSATIVTADGFGLETPLVAAALTVNTDLAYNAWQNLTAAFQNQGPQNSPLDNLIGEVPNQWVQAELTFFEGAVDPEDATKVLGRYAMEHTATFTLHAFAEWNGMGYNGTPSNTILMGPNGIPIGSNFATDLSNGALQYYGIRTNMFTINGITTISTLGGALIKCSVAAGGCSKEGFYPGGSYAVPMPGGGSVILEDGGALGTIVWGTEGSLAAAGE